MRAEPVRSPSGRPPTILQIVPRLDTGGAELTTIEITEAIVRAGGCALVATEGGRMAGEIARRGGTLIPFPATSKNPARMLANARRLAALVRAERVHLIHARSRAPAWSAFVAARMAKVPFVTTYHGAYNESGPGKRLYNSVMARGDLVIANSRFTADLIRKRYETPESRLRVIHRGVDIAQFSPDAVDAGRTSALAAAWGIQLDTRVILLAARLTGWKGQGVLIAAADLLAKAGGLGNATVVLAGDAQGRSGYEAELRAQIAAAGLDDRVRLVGHCADMPAAYKLAYVAVVASTDPEAFGRVAVEAQAMGCPVIATDIGAPPETVLVGEATAPKGWLVSPSDPKALAAAIGAAMRLPRPARAALGLPLRRHVADHFSLAAMQRATLAVYDELLGSVMQPAFDHTASMPFPSRDGA
jgi:glycosyltransferase involved in cell wall biosynthesis